MSELAEPILTDDDRRVWERWRKAAAAHAHQRRVESAIRVTVRALDATPNAALSWSGGKDSTVMVHLVCVRAGARIAVFSEKDDLDYPGEEDYVRALGASWDLDLRIVRPPVSPRAWVSAHAAGMHPGDDIHGRSAGLSKACFYGVVEECNRGFDAVMLGLRSEESAIRRHLRASRGRYYALADGRHRVLPIADWSGLDVFAYAEANGIELLPMYRCVALMHADAPWTLRKSWWLPGSATAYGQVAWLRRYYPSLYRQLRDWIPAASQHT